MGEEREGSLERADQAQGRELLCTRARQEAEGDVGSHDEKGSGVERLKSKFWSEAGQPWSGRRPHD